MHKRPGATSILVPRPWLFAGQFFAFALVPLMSVADVRDSGSPSIASLDEANFVERLRSSSSALVAFVAPWCSVCRTVLAELNRVKHSLAQQSVQLLVAQCDVSREVGLAARYRTWRTPMVLLFPDTRVIAPSLQLVFQGQLLHANIMAFVHNGLRGRAAPSQIRTPEDACRVARSNKGPGAFVGFFLSPNQDSLLQAVWALECASRHGRSFAFAHDAAGLSAERLWRWAGLEWDEGGTGSEEAVLFITATDASCEPKATNAARFTLRGVHDQATSSLSWRQRVDSFCVWCERQVLAPVTVFNAARAAALDGTFDWLLLLFAPSGHMEDEHDSEHLFAWEKKQLEHFIADAQDRDGRYQELLPVIVPWREDDVEELCGSLGADCQEPTTPLKRSHSRSNDDGPPVACVAGQGPDRLKLWAVVLFNTQTRRKFRAPRGEGWCPGDELALADFTTAALSGQIEPFFKSLLEPSAAVRASAPPGVAELVGKTFGRDAVEPVAAGHAEVLLLVYAPWCGHSLNFAPLWHSLAAKVARAAATRAAAQPADEARTSNTPGVVDDTVADASKGQAPNASSLDKKQAGQLLLAQMDGSQNEHQDLPHVTEFPTLLLGVRSPPASANSIAANATKACLPKSLSNLDCMAWAGTDVQKPVATDVRFLSYKGASSLAALQAWLAKHSSFAPMLEDLDSGV